MEYVLAGASAFFAALGGVLQRRAAASAEEGPGLSVELLSYLARRPAYLGGILSLLAAFLLQAAALRYGGLAVVQPLLVTQLLWILAIVVVWFDAPIGAREIGGFVAITAGLAGFLVSAAPGRGGATPTAFGWILAGGGVGVLVVAAVLIARRNQGSFVAALYGAAAGSAFALTAAITRVVVRQIHNGFGAMLSGWAFYALAVTGGAALVLSANAYEAGPITASEPGLTIADPLVAITLGVMLFGEKINLASVRGLVGLGFLAVMIVGAVVLSQSPTVTGEERNAVEPDDETEQAAA